MGVSIVVNASDLGLAAKELHAVMARASDRQALLEDIGSAVEETTRERFNTGTDPDGHPWPPSERAKREGGQTLVDYGHGRDSITHAVGLSHVEVGTNLFYMAVHQEGATIRAKAGGVLAFNVGGQAVFAKSVNIPARPFLGIGATDEAAIDDAVTTFLREAMR